MTTVYTQCDEILRRLKELDRPAVNLLRPGLPSASIRSSACGLDIVFPTCIIDLYQWRDGTEEGKASFGDMGIFPGFFLLSLAKAIETRNDLLRISHPWRSCWLPFLSNGAGGFYGINCHSAPTEDGEICEYITGDTEVHILFSSLGVMLRSIIVCFDRKIFYISEDGGFEADDLRFEEVANECNCISLKDSCR